MTANHGAVITQPVIQNSRGAGPAMGLTVGIVAMAVAVAIVKPWGVIGNAAEMTTTARVAGDPRAATVATVPAIDTDRAVVSEMCLEPNGWRMFAAERWPDRVARRWVRVEPLVGASGPADPRIPLISEPSLAVLAVGYCAPVTGHERPPASVSTTIYRLRHGSPADDPLAWDIIRPPRVLPSADESSLGGAWASPGSTALATSGWGDATLVMRIAAARPGPEDYSRWFGVVIDVGHSSIE